MTKNYIKIIISLWFSLLWANPVMASFEIENNSYNELFSISKDTLTAKKSDTTNNYKPAASNPMMARWQKEKTFKSVAPAIVADKKFKSFPELESYTNNLYLPPNDGKAEFTPEYVQSLFKVDNKTQEVLDAGVEVFSIIEENQRFIDIIGGQEVIDLPVGIKQNISDNSYITLGIVSMEYHPNYTVVDMFAKVKLGELGAELFFGANDVKISREGGIYDEARLNLLADFPIGQNGGQWLITFKGGLNEQGGGNGQTYITINCEGKVKEMAFNADVRIAKTVAVPLKEDGSLKYPAKTTPGTGEKAAGNDSYVGANFSVKAAGLEDLLVELDLPYFALKALPNWGFKMEQTVFDLSDTKNAEGIKFPDIYRSQGLLQGNENLWRGFHAKDVQVTLPPEFKKKGSEKRISIGAQNLFIDNFGVSGDFYATNVLDINEGDASKWQISVDSIGVDLKVNRFIKGGFNGEIVLPISDKNSAGGKLGYKGVITADQFYSVNVAALEDVSFDVFKAKAKIFEGSYVTLEVENNKFYPEANLTGLMSFNAKQDEEFNQFSSESLNDTTAVVDLEFDGLSFQNFKIQTRARPYLSIEYAGFKDDITLPKIAGFELGFYDVTITTDAEENAILALNSFINLDSEGIHGDIRLSVVGALDEGDLLQWKYKEVNVSRVDIDVKRKSFEFVGFAEFFKDDPVYGQGFAGGFDLNLTSIEIEIGARALFGNTGDYRYWFVDAHGRPTKSSSDTFRIFDLGGGVYHHMRKAGMNDDNVKSMSGIDYQPDIDTEIGFKALAAFEVKESFTGLVAIEMAFNSKSAGGGVSRLGFYGGAMLMKGNSSESQNPNSTGNPQYPFGSLDDMQDKVASKEELLGNFHEMSIDKDGIKAFSDAIFPDLLTGEELFAAQVGIDFDFRNRTYWGMFDVFLNAGAIKGEGEKNRLGYLEFYNSPDDWYIWVGTPKKRFGLKEIPIGPYLASFNLYFMTGTILEDPALPPQNVIDILHLTDEELMFGRNFDQELARGVGYAFGAKFELGMGFDWEIVYAKVAVGAGFDLMLRDFGDAQCKDRDGTIGMDGWYSIGQMYAYLQGEIGAQVKIFGMNKQIPILSAGIAVLAQAQLPNPVFIKGYAGVDIKVLGFINIHARLKVVIGEPCEIIGKTGLQDLVMISDITPRDGLSDVDVFDAIQVAFNAPVDSEIPFTDDQGAKTFRIGLKDITVTTNGAEIAGSYEFNDEKDVLIYNSDEILPPEQEISVLVRVSFDEKIGGNWVAVTNEGTPVIEEKEVKFTTGDAPRKIPHKNIQYMYPVVDQRYMLPKEANTGFVQLDKGQEYLFGNGFSDELYFIDENGSKTKVNFSYNTSDKRLNFDIPDLTNEQKYTYALITLNPGDGDEGQAMTAVEFTAISEDLEISNNTLTGSASNDAFISRLDFTFNTSRHNTFNQKMGSLKVRQSVTSLENFQDTNNKIANVGRIELLMDEYEPFGINDIQGTVYTANQALIRYEAIMTDKHFVQDIGPMVYRESLPVDNDITVDRDTGLLGWPPVRSLQLNNSYRDYAATNTNSSFLKTYFPFRWHLPNVYYEDFVDLRYYLKNKYNRNGITNQAQYDKYKYIIEGWFPFIRKEDYKVKFEYVLPKQNTGNSAIINYTNTIGSD